MGELLTVKDLDVGYAVGDTVVPAVRGASLTVSPGEFVGVVGESGSGKTTLVLGLLRILGLPGIITGGEVLFDGQDVLAMDEDGLRRLRWREISIVPQSALNALNPVLTVGAQMIDTLQAHTSKSASEARARAAELMALVDLDPVHLDSYPHELSGGMRQRVAVGLALALEPRLVVMDEPTTALDVVVERDILRRVMELQQELGFAVLFITHDLPLLLEIATKMVVMYAGRVVEVASVDVMREGGRHPYSQGLMAAIPPMIGETRQAVSIPGSTPSLAHPPPGCRFHPRCPVAEASCGEGSEPPLTGSDHRIACPVVAP